MPSIRSEPNLSGTVGRYGAMAQLLHWLTASLVLAAFLLSAGGPPSRVYADANAAALQLHD